MQRENNNFDKDQHQFNIQRRIMERNFGQDSTNKPRQNYNQFLDTTDTMGEITGEFLDTSQLDKGMPFRPTMTTSTDRYQLDDELDTEQPDRNPHLDFNLYDTKPQLKVSYFDPFTTSKSTIGYSSIGDETRILHKTESQNNELLLSEAINIFTFDFMHKFTENLKTKKSLILSPFNILQSFCLLYIGSKNNTEKELKNYFSLPDKKTTFGSLFKINQHMANANALSKLNLICLPNFITLNDAYVSYINKLGHFAKFNPMESTYEANKLNNMISNSTNGMIKNVIQPTMLTNNNILEIINTIYFYSHWKQPFPVSNTKMDIFNGINKQQIMMMAQLNKKHRYFEDNYNQILEMDYIGDLFTMGFVLPKSQYNDAMITHEQFEYYIKNLKETPINVIKIPKFKHETKYRIDNLFKKFGLREVFTNADISDIIPPINGFPIIISEIIHTAVIIVNEAGTKASASTISEFSNSYSESKRKINFIANHQFLYYVRFKPYNTLVFIGQYY